MAIMRKLFGYAAIVAANVITALAVSAQSYDMNLQRVELTFNNGQLYRTVYPHSQPNSAIRLNPNMAGSPLQITSMKAWNSGAGPGIQSRVTIREQDVNGSVDPTPSAQCTMSAGGDYCSDSTYYHRRAAGGSVLLQRMLQHQLEFHDPNNNVYEKWYTTKVLYNSQPPQIRSVTFDRESSSIVVLADIYQMENEPEQWAEQTQISWSKDGGGSSCTWSNRNHPETGDPSNDIRPTCQIWGNTSTTPGTVNYTVTVRDMFNLVATTSGSFYYEPPDSTPPTIVVDDPAEDFTNLNGVVRVAGSASDNISAITGVHLHVRGSWGQRDLGSLPVNNGRWETTVNLDSLNMPYSNEEPYHFYVTATDEAQNTGEGIRHFFYADQTPPTVHIISPENTQKTETGWIVKGYATDPESTINEVQLTYEFTPDGTRYHQTVPVNGDNWEVQIPELVRSKQPYALTATAHDRAGNRGEMAINFFYGYPVTPNGVQYLVNGELRPSPLYLNRADGVVSLEPQVNVDARPYTQRWESTQWGTCDVPLDQTNCRLAPTAPFGVDNDVSEHYATNSFVVEADNPGSEMRSPALTEAVFSDLSAPQAFDYGYNADTFTLWVNGAEKSTGALQGMVGMQSVTFHLSAVDGSHSTAYTTTTPETYTGDNFRFSYTIDATQHNTQYNLTVELVDNFGNVTVTDAALADLTNEPPVLTAFTITSGGENLDVSSERRFNRSNGVIPLDLYTVTVQDRPYTQTLVTQEGSCRIPPRATQCSTEPNQRQFGVDKSNAAIEQDVKVIREGTSLESAPYPLRLYSDLSNPFVSHSEHDPAASLYTIHGTEYGAGYYDDRIGLTEMEATFTRRDTSEVALQAVVTEFSFNSHNFSHAIDVSTLVEGSYDVAIRLKDHFGNEVTEQGTSMYVDVSPPQITIDEIPEEGAHVRNIDDLHIHVSDNYDEKPALTSAAISGGANNADAQDLPITQRLDGTWRIEPPPMYPSETIAYTITLTAQDDRGNASVLEREFYFTPEVMDSAWGESFNLPVTGVALADPDTGYYALTSPVLRDVYGRALEETSLVVASLADTSTTSVIVNGTEIFPGESKEVHGAYDFAASNGVLTLPLLAVDEGASFELMVSTEIAAAPYIRTRATTIAPVSEAVTEAWAVPHMATVTMSAADTSNQCELLLPTETNLDRAAKANPFTSPMCIVDWVDPLDNSAADPITGVLEGQAETIGPDTIAYDLKLYHDAEEPVTLHSVSRDLLVEERTLTATVSDSVSDTGAKRVESYVFALDNPEDCQMTTKRDMAQAYPEQYCIVELGSTAGDFEPLHFSSKGDAAWRGRFNDAGQVQIDWRIGIMSKSGGYPVWLGEGVHEVDVVEPPAPSAELMKAIVLGTGELAVDYDGSRAVAVLRNDSSYDIDIAIEKSNTTEIVTYSGVRDGSYKVVNGHSGALWETAEYTIRLSYTDYPESQTVLSEVGRIMPTTRLRTALNGDRSGLDTNAYDVEFMMGESRAGELVYEPASMGQWNVYLATYNRPTDEYTPITETKTMADGGITFTISPETLQELGEGNRYYAVATLVAPQPELERVITSRALSPRIYKGTPIQALVSATVTEGPAPLGTRLTLRGDRAEIRALGGVQWQVSSDNGTTWVDVEGADRTSLSLSVEEGEHQYRAKLVNRHSSAVSYTEPVGIWAFHPLNIEISGNAHTAPGVPAVLSATVSDEEGVIEFPVIEWIYRGDDGLDVVKTGSTISITLNTAQNLSYRVRARRTEADPGSRNSWTEQRSRLMVETPRTPRLSLRGPRIFEVGYEYTFNALATPSWRDRSSTLDVAQEWVLPSGEIIEGDTLTWSPPQELLDQVGMGGYVTVRHRAWIDGYSETTLREAEKKVRLWKYEWPNFLMDISQRYEAAPSTASITVRPEDISWFRHTYGEPIHYEWTLPEGVEVIAQRDNRVSLSIENEGTYQLTAFVYDDRGNSATVTEALTLAPTPAYDLRLDTYSSNRYDRAPYTLSPRLNVSGGHRENRVADITWYLDNELLTGIEGRRPRIDITEPGNYVLRAEVQTELNVSSEIEASFVAHQNQLPNCTIEAYRIRDTVTVKADCRDPDGSVTNYNWWLDGKQIALTSYKFSFETQSGDGLGLSTVDLVATDDVGDTVSVSRTIEY